MKLKYIIPSFIAVIAMFTGCADDNEPTYLSNLKVSSSYVAFDVKGGTQKITVTATEDWSMDFMVPVKADSLDDEKGIVKYNVPTSQMATKENSWIKVSQLSGGAGTTDISFTVGATTATVRLPYASKPVTNIRTSSLLRLTILLHPKVL